MSVRYRQQKVGGREVDGWECSQDEEYANMFNLLSNNLHSYHHNYIQHTHNMNIHKGHRHSLTLHSGGSAKWINNSKSTQKYTHKQNIHNTPKEHTHISAQRHPYSHMHPLITNKGSCTQKIGMKNKPHTHTHTHTHLHKQNRHINIGEIPSAQSIHLNVHNIKFNKLTPGCAKKRDRHRQLFPSNSKTVWVKLEHGEYRRVKVEGAFGSLSRLKPI